MKQDIQNLIQISPTTGLFAGKTVLYHDARMGHIAGIFGPDDDIASFCQCHGFNVKRVVSDE